MKRVRYLIGAVGAVPALGVIAPTAAAAAQPASATPAAAKMCATDYHHSTRGAANFGGYDYFGTPTDRHCLWEARGTITRSQVGLEMRARAYWKGNQIYQRYVHGTIIPFSGVTSFYITSINRDASKVCEALVYSTNTNRVAYGPVCEPVSP
jgi:hypothetical protein